VSYSGYQEIIDMHVHIYPQKIAAKAVAAIGKFYEIAMSGGGTMQDLLIAQEAAGIDYYLISSTATTPEQVVSINNFMAESAKLDPRIMALGTIHPDYPDQRGEITRMLSLGLKGLKLHPDFQKYPIDDPAMFPVYDIFQQLRLPILFHIGDRRMDYSSPLRLIRILENFPNLIAIAAHLGGYSVWDTYGKEILGKNVYIDTSSSLAFMEPRQAVDIIRRHGCDKVLFGTDFPMWEPRKELERFLALGLSDAENKMILSANAKRLFAFGAFSF